MVGFVRPPLGGASVSAGYLYHVCTAVLHVKARSLDTSITVMLFYIDIYCSMSIKVNHSERLKTDLLGRWRSSRKGVPVKMLI